MSSLRGWPPYGIHPKRGESRREQPTAQARSSAPLATQCAAPNTVHVLNPCAMLYSSLLPYPSVQISLPRPPPAAVAPMSPMPHASREKDGDSGVTSAEAIAVPTRLSADCCDILQSWRARERASSHVGSCEWPRSHADVARRIAEKASRTTRRIADSRAAPLPDTAKASRAIVSRAAGDRGPLSLTRLTPASLLTPNVLGAGQRIRGGQYHMPGSTRWAIQPGPWIPLHSFLQALQRLGQNGLRPYIPP